MCTAKISNTNENKINFHSIENYIVLSSVFKDGLLDFAVFPKCLEKQRIGANHVWFIGENLEIKDSTEKGMIHPRYKKEIFWDGGSETT